jgi:dTDP-4-dehydrorhamnose reductase
VNSGEAVSWHQFAETIFEMAYQSGYQGKIKKVLPISSEEYKTPALRPKNSRLSCKKLHDVFGIKPAEWRTMLEWSLPLILKTI